MLLRHAFGTASEGICLRTRSDARPFNLGRLIAKTKVREALIRDMLFADGAAVTTHIQQELQAPVDRFSQACKDFGLTINLEMTNVLGQDTMELPAVTIDDFELDVFEQFTHLGSTITDNLSLDTDIDKRFRKAATALARLTSRVWTSRRPSVCDQDGSVQCLCRQHTDIRQRDVDHVCQTGEKTQFLPPEKHPTYPGHISAGQSVQRRGPVPSQPSEHVYPAQTAQAALAGACLQHGEMATSQKTFSMESWHLVGEPNAAHSCATRMSARETRKHLTSTPSPGRTLQPTA